MYIFMVIYYHRRYVSNKNITQVFRHLGIIWRSQSTMLCVDLPKIRIQPILRLPHIQSSTTHPPQPAVQLHDQWPQDSGNTQTHRAVN